MAIDGGHGNGGNTMLGFGSGLVLGAALGVGIGLLLAAENTREWRRDAGLRARRLRDDTLGVYRRAGDVVGEWGNRSQQVADRLRTAAAECLREARRHSATPRDPRSADLAGVDGTVEGIEGA